MGKRERGGGGVGVGESIWEEEDKYQFRNSDKYIVGASLYPR